MMDIFQSEQGQLRLCIFQLPASKSQSRAQYLGAKLGDTIHINITNNEVSEIKGERNAVLLKVLQCSQPDKRTLKMVTLLDALCQQHNKFFLSCKIVKKMRRRQSCERTFSSFVFPVHGAMRTSLFLLLEQRQTKP